MPQAANDNKTDYINIEDRKSSSRAKFDIENTRRQQRATAEHRPYCFKCPREEAHRQITNLNFEVQAKGFSDLPEEENWRRVYKTFMEKSLFDKYEDPEHFTLQSTQVWREPVNLRTGLMMPTEKGVIEDYTCRAKHGVTVFVPTEVLEKRQKNKK